MLRVEMHDSSDAFIIRLEGRLTGDGADHVRSLVTRCQTDKNLVVDLKDVTFIDVIGEQVLALLKRLRAEFIADTSYVLDVCERLHLPLARNVMS